MRIHGFTFTLLASLLAGTATAHAKPHHVVVLDFDGPRALADTAKSAVMAVLGDQYSIVATRLWETARAQSGGHGPQQWRQASKQAGVDAVIEGWVQDEGRHHVLTIAVRDATTGNQIDTISEKLGDHGISAEAGHHLAAQLEDIFGFIDGDLTSAPATSMLPEVREANPMLGSHLTPPTAPDDPCDDEDDDCDEPRPVRHHGRHATRHVKRPRKQIIVEENNDQDEQDEQTQVVYVEKKSASASPASPGLKKDGAAPVTVAAATDDQRDTNELINVFGHDSGEAAVISGGQTQHVPRSTPRFAISLGGYLSSRGISFEQDPNSSQNLDYPAQSDAGLAISVEAYPWPLKKQDGGLSGLGFSFAIAHSIGSTFAAMDSSGYGDFTMNHSQWDVGLHYRYPLDIITFDGSVSYGNDTHTIEDLATDIVIPDTSTTYLSAGGHLDLFVTDRSSIGFGAKYLYVLDTGDISSEDWFGSGSAWGLMLDGDFVIPLPANLYVRGDLEYRRVSIDFEGSGVQAQNFGLWTSTDTSITGYANLGINF
jgi:hypothetical protein